MKINFRCCVSCLFVLLLAAGLHSTYAQNEVKRTQDLAIKDCCYEEKNPNRTIVSKDPGIVNEMQTSTEILADNQQFRPLNKSSKTSAHQAEPVVMEQRSGSRVLLNQGAILDKYVYLNRSARDTITVYVDVYNRGSLMMPVGLKYSGEQN